ncbi:hypothetical protein, partial [Paenibacillus terrae]|uniref:hypothetical protein n=1 Tax=Paenibacillus terrae TaxID=159743 RepID=UPI001BB08123
VEGELYFRNVRCKKSNPWIKDSKHFAGLLTWFRNDCQFYDMTTDDVRKVIQFCLYSSLIPEQTKYEFEAMLKP